MSKELEEKIQKWCADEGIFKERIPDDTANFHFILNYPKNIPNPMDIMQPKGKDDLIIIGAGTGISPEHLSKIKALTPKAQEEFLWDFMFMLGNRPTEFHLQMPSGILEMFVASTEIFSDGLTKDRLMRAINEVYKSKLLGIWLIQRRFGIPKDASADTGASQSMFR